MLDKLKKEEKIRVHSNFCGHELYKVCDAAFLPRAGKLDSAQVNTEDIFCEVAQLLDTLNEYPHFQSGQKDIEKYYSQSMLKYREWADTTVRDREMIADTVFRIVRKLMSHRWQLCYSEELYDAMSNVLNERSDLEDSSEFDKALFEYSNNLDTWINQDYNGHLCEEIENTISDKPAKTKLPSGRKSVDVEKIFSSFDYLPQVDNRVQRLQAFHRGMDGRFFKVKLKDFVDIFTNKSTTKKILWLGDIIELKYLINKLVSSKWIKLSNSCGKWQLVCARFNIRIKKNEKADDRLTNDSSYVEEDLNTSQFNKSKKAPNTHDELDRIIAVLDPKIDYTEALNDYLDYQNSIGDHDELEDTADALAHGLNTDLRT